MKSILYPCCALVVGLVMLTGPVAAQRVTAEPGLLVMEDGAKLFSAKARSQAEEILRNHKTAPRTQLNIITFAELPPARAEAFAKVKGDRAKEQEFMRQWALEEARSNRDKGVVVLIAWDIKKLEILTDRSSRERGFNDSRESELKNILTSAFKEALTKEGEERAKILDGALIKASQLVVDHIKSASRDAASAGGGGEREAPAWTQWVCIGLAVLLGLWLIMGIVRGLTGGGGGGGPGGGGFFSSMLGGLFGAAAGMYLYNSLFGGGMNSAYGDGGTADGMSNTGEGDFSGSGGTGGDFGDAGGDFGGGGDYGGGGDW